MYLDMEFISGLGPTLAAAASIGIASSLYFRKYEPTITSFARVLAFATVLARFATTPQWDEHLISDPKLPVFLVVGAFVSGLGGSILHYRLFSSSHPLHNIPGPVLAPPNEISTADYNAVLPIHGAKSWIRGTSYNATVYSKNGESTENNSMLNLIDHQTHTPRRRIWDRAFTIQSLKDYEPMLLARLAELCDQFHARQGTVIDLNEWMGFLVFDVTSDLAYGGGTSFLKTARDQGGLLSGVVAALRLQGRTMAIPWLSNVTAYSPLARKSYPFIKYAKDRFFDRIKDGNPKGGKDFLWHLNNEGGEGGSQVSMVAQAADAALIMAVMMYYLIRYPEIYDRLEKAIDEALADKELTHINGHDFPVHDQVKNIPLLDACIDETLRIHPPLSFEPNRQAPDGGVMIGGRLIPGGTQVRVVSHVIQTDPANFEKPLEFIPDRWLKKDDDKTFNKGAFLPFCVGKQFAYQEMRLFTTTIMSKYKLKFRDGFDSQAWANGIEDNGTLLEIYDPLEVVVSRRT
ncbi:hypothetical protein RQP46_005778 [Phenoliferia psychrophenolica]